MFGGVVYIDVHLCIKTATTLFDLKNFKMKNLIFGVSPYEIDQKFILSTQRFMMQDVLDLEKSLGVQASADLSISHKADNNLLIQLNFAKSYTSRCVSNCFGLEKRKSEFCQAAQSLDNVRSMVGMSKIWTV